jgi:hypothetical protein
MIDEHRCVRQICLFLQQLRNELDDEQTKSNDLLTQLEKYKQVDAQRQHELNVRFTTVVCSHRDAFASH